MLALGCPADAPSVEKPDPIAALHDDPKRDAGQTPTTDDPSVPEPAAEADEGQPDVGTAEPAAVDSSPTDPPPAEDTPPDTKELLKKAKAKRTSDQDAQSALEAALAAGSKPRDVAQVAVERGMALHDAPNRAKALFEWASKTDPKFADPVWQLAKQAVITGDIEEVRARLKEVKARGGRKLLKQIEFDPMWEIVRDDPEVRGLL